MAEYKAAPDTSIGFSEEVFPSRYCINFHTVDGEEVLIREVTDEHLRTFIKTVAKKLRRRVVAPLARINSQSASTRRY
jgi:hypothetical protein